MIVVRWVTTAALVMALPAAAAAQVQEPVTTTTTTQITTSPVEGHWLASGFVGTNFARDADEASFDFGGTLGYLWRGSIGLEFHANLSPDFKLEGARRALLLGTEPWINSYMGNAMFAAPLGDEGQVKPYVSGGVGVLTLRSNAIITDGERNEFEPDDTHAAMNVGAGLMGFRGAVGFRGDVRFFRGFEQQDIQDLDPVRSSEEAIGSAILSTLSFWRANVGVVFRW